MPKTPISSGHSEAQVSASPGSIPLAQAHPSPAPAQSFGIITSFYFLTFPVPTVATNFAYSWYGQSASAAASLFSKWQAFGANQAPSDLGVSFTIGTGGSLEISGVFYGSSDQFHEVFDGFIDSAPTGYQQTVTEMSWIDSLASLAGGQKLNTTGVSDSRDDFAAKSLMTPQAVLISDAALQSYFSYLFNTQTSTNWFGACFSCTSFSLSS